MSNWRDELLKKLMGSRTTFKDEPKEHTRFVVFGTPSPKGGGAPNHDHWTFIGVDWNTDGAESEAFYKYARQTMQEVSQHLDEEAQRRNELLVDYKVGTTTGAIQQHWLKAQFALRKERAIIHGA
jgi:hypothetical protein